MVTKLDKNYIFQDSTTFFFVFQYFFFPRDSVIISNARRHSPSRLSNSLRASPGWQASFPNSPLSQLRGELYFSETYLLTTGIPRKKMCFFLKLLFFLEIFLTIPPIWTKKYVTNGRLECSTHMFLMFFEVLLSSFFGWRERVGYPVFDSQFFWSNLLKSFFTIGTWIFSSNLRFHQYFTSKKHMKPNPWNPDIFTYIYHKIYKNPPFECSKIYNRPMDPMGNDWGCLDCMPFDSKISVKVPCRPLVNVNSTRRWSAGRCQKLKV